MRSLLSLVFLALITQFATAQSHDWPQISADAASTRSTTLDQINPSNFEQLEVAWQWTPQNLGSVNARGCPIYVDGMLITTAGPRRTVVSLDPKTGEVLWEWEEPSTFRREYSMRANHGKGVAYAEVDGKPVIFITTAAFFLHALDPKTGKPLPDWGKPVPLEGFPQTGAVDLIPDLIADWGPWLEADEEYDPNIGIPIRLGYITSSSPPVVVNGVVVVGNSAEQGYNQSRIENVPGDILGYDAKTGEFLWKFNVIPRPGEFGHETWENDAWKWTGDVSSWAPMSWDEELGLVYIPTNGPTIDFYGGFHPGDNLYGTSLIALDVKTGERAWHYQLVHHDIWNYDTPVAPMLLDVTMDGETVPIVTQITKQNFAYTFNRKTGEPIWPIEERPVPRSLVPGEKLSPTQPFPTKPLAYDLQGLGEDDLIDFTPALRKRALEVLEPFHLGPLFQPPLHRDNDLGKEAAFWVPGSGGGSNITGPPAADPSTGIIYVTSKKGGSANIIAPGEERDAMLENPTGTTFSDYANLRGASSPRTVDGLPIWKPPYSRITAIDMNTGEHLWWIPIGDTPARIRNHAALQGVDLPNTGSGQDCALMVTPSMLLYTGTGTPDGPVDAAGGGGDRRYLYAVDKKTGDRLGRVETTGLGRYGMMSYMHDGQQYIVLQVPGSLVALRLP